jgi:choline dehydrogenase-like flavoprotein
MKIVIGSGPAGVACAEALLARGEEVLMLDAGMVKEARQEELLARIKNGNQDAARELITLQSNMPVSDQGVPLKLAYGSDFPYRDVEDHLGFMGERNGLLPSLAMGGLSNVWGAAMLPYRQNDIPDWPVTVEDLAPHYRAALRMTGISGRSDDLGPLFPLYSDQIHQLNSSSQAARLLAGLNGIRESLQKDGIIFGSSRLAVGPNRFQASGCVYCGQCLYGCPYGVIYNSAQHVSHLLAESGKRFSYQGDVIVNKITEENGLARIEGHDRLTRSIVNFSADKVFLAAGTIPSSRIMLKSLEAYDQPILLRDSQYFVFPLFSLRGRITQETLHTLSQVFLEIEDNKISSHTVHLQVYTYNDIISKVLRAKFRFPPGLGQLIAPLLEQRLLVVQGYLHSADSGAMSLKLLRRPDGRDHLMMEQHPAMAAKKKILQIMAKLSRHFRRLGLFPIRSGLEITPPGRGFHSGGGFPMRRHPDAFESDTLGRVSGFSRTHLVDASIFPSIPATTITLTAMANSHRIGSNSSRTCS